MTTASKDNFDMAISDPILDRTRLRSGRVVGSA